MDRQLFKETFSQLHASEDTITEVFKMAREQDRKRKTRLPARTGALIALAAVLLMGSAFAAVSYKLRTEPVGELAVAVSAAAEEAPGTVAFSGEASEDVKFTSLDVTAGWLPEGMTLFTGETTKWSYEDNWGRGGFSLGFFPLNAGSATFCQVVPDAERQETLEINGHEAIYVRSSLQGFNQKMYISYPEYNAVLEISIGDDTDFDTAKRFAENLTVTAGTIEVDLDYIAAMYKDARTTIETGAWVNTADEDASPEDVSAMEDEWWERNPANRAAQSGMADAHEIGESFPVTFLDFNGGHRDGPFVDLTVTVTDISVRDDYSALRDTQYLDMDWASRVNENGKLPTEDYNFYKHGDGIDTPSSTLVATLPDQQLYMVAVTVDVTNTTDETVVGAGYNGLLLSVAETADGWQVTSPQPEDPSVEYDDDVSLAHAGLTEMNYWDLRDPNSNGGNEIVDLAPGETVTIQMGFIVSECQLGDLWFYMNDADITGPDEIHVGYVPVP